MEHKLYRIIFSKSFEENTNTVDRQLWRNRVEHTESKLVISQIESKKNSPPFFPLADTLIFDPEIETSTSDFFSNREPKKKNFIPTQKFFGLTSGFS